MKVTRNKLIKPYSIDVDVIDFPIIDESNALFYTTSTIDYQKSFPIPNINNGIMLHEDRYYFFTHNIITTPRNYRRDKVIGSIASYDIHQITKDKFNEINENDGFYNYWDLMFNAWINYGESLNYVRNNNQVTVKKTITPIVDGILEIPYSISPSDLHDYDDIDSYISINTQRYKNGSKFDKNLPVFRDMLMQSILA